MGRFVWPVGLVLAVTAAGPIVERQAVSPQPATPLVAPASRPRGSSSPWFFVSLGGVAALGAAVGAATQGPDEDGR